MCRRRSPDVFIQIDDMTKYYYMRAVATVCGLFIVLNWFLWGFLVDTSNSIYYTWFFFPPVLIQTLSYVYLLTTKDEWTFAEFEFYKHLTCCDLLGCCFYSSLPMMRWISIKFLIFIYLLLIWMKPLNGYIDKVGFPTNASSCTTDFSGESGGIYNPNGAFSFDDPYGDGTVKKKFCPMDQTYAWPNLNTSIQGYEESPLLSVFYTGLCSAANKLPVRSSLIINGFVDTYICEGSYPSPVLGVIPPVTVGSYGLTIEFCPGNTDQPVCITSSGFVYFPQTESEGCPLLQRTGVPRKICPICLSAYRKVSRDYRGPLGYEHCEIYDPNNPPPINLLCTFCPGRGFGWNPNEKYDTDSMLLFLILTSIMFGSHLLEYIILDFVLKAIRWYLKDEMEREKSN